MNAEILAVGTELLLGDIVNTNAQSIARRLADIGISVFYHTAVGDNTARLYDAYNLGFQRAELVIATGGLGPTKDDLTKEVAATYFDKKLVLDEKSLEEIRLFFTKQGKSVTEGNKKQAYFPEGALILPNAHGTAPGCIIEAKGKTLILLPGPPREMVPMLEDYVIPYLCKRSDGILVSKVLRICGIGEGHMEEKIQDMMETQTNPTIAPYAKEGEVILRITAKASTKEEAVRYIAPIEAKIRERLGEDVYGEGEDTLEEVVGNLLLASKLTVGTAESCTGGLIASRLVNYPGISKAFMEGAVTYSNEAKIQRLHVHPSTLEEYGAVSKETAAEMAAGIAKTAGTDVGISTTGIAGPGGGSEEKPVGLVYVGLFIRGKIQTKELRLTGDRQKIRQRTVIFALDWLRRELIALSPWR